MVVPRKLTTPPRKRYTPRLLLLLATLALVSSVWVLLDSTTTTLVFLLEHNFSAEESSWSEEDDEEERSFSNQYGDGDDEVNDQEKGSFQEQEEDTTNSAECVWDVSLDDCYRLLKPRLVSTRHWILMGDSNMRKLAERVWKQPSVSRSGRARCFDLEYYRLPRASVWVPPNASLGEGPARYGLEEPFCHDTVSANQHSPGILEGTSFEYLVVEFARDVTLPTDQTTTTQETVARYLRANPHNDPRTPETTACLVGTGLHDRAALKTVQNAERRLAIYLRNVRDYLGLLKPFCGTIVWLGINAIRGDRFYFQRNNEIKAWNHGVYDMLARQRSLDMVVAMDVFPKTSRTEHADNAHMTPEYYQELAGFLFTNITSFLQLVNLPRYAANRTQNNQP